MLKNNKLLLLSCCAPCSVGVIHFLKKSNTPFDVLFFNPNIYPALEYEKRLNENKKICDELDIPFFSLEYNHKEWLSAIQGFEREPERGLRCSLCFKFRLQKALIFAKEHGYREFSSVLGFSRYKNLEQVNLAAQELEQKFSFPYNYTNWRKGGIQELTHQLIRDKNLYKQDYCGCPFSKQS